VRVAYDSTGTMATTLRVVVFGGWLLASGTAVAGPVGGKLELPPPPARPQSATKGFIDRVENPLAPARPVSVTPQMVIVLEGEAKPAAPGQITWSLVGESFARPVIGVPAGAEVVIRNESRVARSLVAAEDSKLVPAGPINPTGTKSFRPAEPGKVFTIGDADAPHLIGRVVVVNTPYVAYVDENGKFEIPDVAEGAYKLRIYYKDGWLDSATDVTVSGKSKTEVNPKVPSLAAPAKK